MCYRYSRDFREGVLLNAGRLPVVVDLTNPRVSSVTGKQMKDRCGQIAAINFIRSSPYINFMTYL